MKNKTVVIYSTKDCYSLAAWSKLVGVYKNTTRRKAFNDFINSQPRNKYKWDIDKRCLVATYRSGRRHGRDRNFYFVAYMTEEEFNKKLKTKQDAYLKKYGCSWTKYHK